MDKQSALDPRGQHGAGTREGQAGCQEKVLHPEVVGHRDRLPGEVVMAPSLPEFTKRLGNAPRHMG